MGTALHDKIKNLDHNFSCRSRRVHEVRPCQMLKIVFFYYLMNSHSVMIVLWIVFIISFQLTALIIFQSLGTRIFNL